MAVTARFRYALETVLRVRVHAMDSARAEEVTARQVVLERQETVAKIRGIVATLEQEVREILTEGRTVDLQRQDLVTRYLASVRERLTGGLAELSQAENVHEQVRRSLGAHLQKVRVLERHRDSKAAQHWRDWAGAEQRAQDDIWLAGIANHD